MRGESLKFEGIFASLHAKIPTGSLSEEEIQQAALEIYNGKATGSQLDTFLRNKNVSPDRKFLHMVSLKNLHCTHMCVLVLSAQQESGSYNHVLSQKEHKAPSH